VTPRRSLVYTPFNRVLIDSIAIMLALYAAYLIRFDGGNDAQWAAYRPQFVSLLPYVLAATLLSFWAFGVYRFVWRYFSIRELLTIFAALGATTAAWLALRLFLPRELTILKIPLGVIASQFVLAFLATTAVRLLRRMLYERSSVRRLDSGASRARVLLVGAGNAGVIVAREIASRPDLKMKAVGFVDDDPRKLNTRIHGIKVIGSTDELARLAERHRVDQVKL
jgi:FlaA1/EpsC-like NDP-sugar epimerase